MYEFFKNDNSAFKKEMTFILGLIVVVFIICLGIMNYAGNAYIERHQNDLKIKQQEYWLNNFDLAGNEELLDSLPVIVKEKDADAAIQYQMSIFKNNNLVVTDVKNKNIPARSQGKKKTPGYIQCDVQLDGEWNNFISALNQLENKYLVSVTSLQIEQNAKASGIKAKVQYRIIFI